MSRALERPRPRAAPEELLVLARAEELCAWLLERTARWPKGVRTVLTQRIESHALDCLEELVQARYRREGRFERLEAVNLTLERMRFLLRAAKARGAGSAKDHEGAARRLDEIGRMLHGWRGRLRSGGGR